MVINIDKPIGWTSTDVVRRLRNVMLKGGYPKKVKVGHAGTLDPLASGVLVICTEKDTKRVDALQAEAKEYLFTLELGATTVSFDLEHPISERFAIDHITEEMIHQAVQKQCGRLSQIPPLYSAKRIDGRRAYDLARGGAVVEDVAIKAAEVEVYSIEVVSIEMPYVTIRARCSRGTYVRSLARDIGVDLGGGAYLTALRRTRSGGMTEQDSLSIEEAEKILSIYHSEPEN